MVTYCEEETEEEANEEPYLYLFERGNQVDPEINTDLTEAQCGQVQQLVAEYKDVCSVVSQKPHASLHTASPQGRPSQSPTSPGVWQQKVQENVRKEVNDLE